MPIPPKKMQAFIQQSKKKSPFPPKKMKPGEEEDEDEAKGEGNPGKGKSDEQEEKGQEEGGGEKDYSQIVEEEVERVADGEGDEELMEKMADFNPEDNPPAWVDDEAIWEKAMKAVDPEGEGSKYDQPFAVVAHVYKRMGGKIKE